MGKTGAVRRFTLRKSPAAIDAVLRRLVCDAHRDVPVYRQSWEAALVRTERFKGVEDLMQLPIITKGDLLTCDPAGRLRRNPRKGRTVWRVTSGMSGANLEVHMSRAELVFRRLNLWSRMWRDAGRPLPLTIVQAGAWIPPGSRGEILAFNAFPLRAVHISRRLPITEQARALAKARPTILTGCPSSLELLAIEVSRLEIDSIRPAVVVTRGEILRPQVRELLGSVFRCRVADYYSAEETGLIAWQCPDAPDIMHVNRDACVVEILDESGVPTRPGEEGDVVVTNLFNRTMPFIRYRIGDRSARLPDSPVGCHCRRAEQSIRAPLGRSDDFIVLPSRERISPRLVDDIVYLASIAPGGESRFYRSLRDYQIVQDSPAGLMIRFLTDESAPAVVHQTLREGMSGLHPDLHCDLVCVSTIEPERSGKRKRVISSVSAGSQISERREGHAN
ncbi:MAG: hypothetical protein WBC63_07345 [Candidatus Bipolaricaulia bacterium]